MRILFDSKLPWYKSPFGCITPGEHCCLRIKIPTSVAAKKVRIVIERENGQPYEEFSMEKEAADGPYDIFRGQFSLPETGLFFYYFRIANPHGPGRQPISSL